METHWGKQRRFNNIIIITFFSMLAFVLYGISKNAPGKEYETSRCWVKDPNDTRVKYWIVKGHDDMTIEVIYRKKQPMTE